MKFASLSLNSVFIIILFVSIIFSSFSSFAQVNYGSGTITFKTQDGKKYPFSAKASHLVWNPNAYRGFYGVTNEPYQFSNWYVSEGVLGIDDFDMKHDKLTVYGNPSISLYAEIKTNENQNILARVIDINGKIVSVPKITNMGNITIIKDPLTHLESGVYFIQVTGDINLSFQFIKNNRFSQKNSSPVNVFEALNKKNRLTINPLIHKNEQAKNNENYKITLSSNDIVDNIKNVEIIEGDNNHITIDVELAYVGEQTGDVLISAQLFEERRNHFFAENGITIKLTNTQTPDSTYTITTDDSYGIFWNIYVADEHNPTQYKVEITDTDADPRFFKTTKYFDIYQDENWSINGSKLIDLDTIPNEQNLTVYTYTSENLEKDAGVTVELHRSDTDALINSQTSDNNGKTIFNNISGNINVYTVVKKAGTYTKTNGNHSIPLIDKMSEMNDHINVTTVKYLYNKDDIFITADTLQMYRIRNYNTEFLLGHLHMYFPPVSGGNQIFKDWALEFAELLGFEGAIIPSDTIFPDHSYLYWNGLIDGYQPYPENRQVYEGQIGTNITNYGGSGTFTRGKILPNGNEIIFYTSALDLGGLDKGINHHEWGHVLGVPLLNGNTTNYKNSRDTSAGQIFELKDCKFDIETISKWLQLGKYHYDTTDSQGKMMEYNLTTKFE